VLLAEEVGGLEDGEDTRERVFVEQQRRDHGLFGTDVVRREADGGTRIGPERGGPAGGHHETFATSE
jgi:hypothetical protein